jgi:hypothetical protein
MTTGKIIAAVAVSLDGFIAGADDSPAQPLGLGGDGLFTWFEDGDTPGRFYPVDEDVSRQRVGLR